MKTIEIKAKTDKNGNLSISEKLNLSNKEVRVLILVEEDEEMDENSWLTAISNNPSFIFFQNLNRIFIQRNTGSHLMIKNYFLGLNHNCDSLFFD